MVIEEEPAEEDFYVTLPSIPHSSSHWCSSAMLKSTGTDDDDKTQRFFFSQHDHHRTDGWMPSGMRD